MASCYALLRDGALAVARDGGAGIGARCGAALRVLSDPQTPEVTFFTQHLLTSAIVYNDQALLVKASFWAVSRRFVAPWERFAENPFRLTSPRTSVPVLKSMVLDVREGRAGLKALIETAARVLGLTAGGFLQRVR